MHKCRKCGEVFHSEDAGIYYNPCSYGERTVYEEWSCCPACGSTNIIDESEDDYEYEDDDEA